MQPPLRVDRLARRVRVGVADHHVGAARDDLADALVVGASIRSSTPGTGWPTPASRRLPGRATVSTGRGLGEAVALGEPETEPEEELLGLARKRGAARR